MPILTTKWHVGDTVTCKEAVPAYYDQGTFTPGTHGRIAAIAVPVTGRRRYFLVVDFVVDGVTRRAALHADNVKRV
jgi:hypothetical protein